ncbi:hypothetical protein [Streptomyces scabiei]|uniref:hypothetical protein n=1 Tax=Streptomyces scabiei TaxID=1930 RepID=UPI0029B07CBE|nr:hypothetical protein [Streptomyces scabiei]MDX2800125.1 hypothetical protein [Streptomyces scabiei]MDX3125372.1 hypothetical protein [Streptomyces scabiei]MDX3280145.1 hypothetical protein [Streptomyces scabiei]MDX3280163.1 hypothetical protein [Streptomyces scabiei]
MADAWEQRLPDTILTATAVEAIRHALEATPVQVPVPVKALEQLVRVAMWVSRGRSMAFTPDPDPKLGAIYPDATARFALGALDDAGLLQQFRTPT